MYVFNNKKIIINKKNIFGFFTPSYEDPIFCPSLLKLRLKKVEVKVLKIKLYFILC